MFTSVSTQHVTLMRKMGLKHTAEYLYFGLSFVVSDFLDIVRCVYVYKISNVL